MVTLTVAPSIFPTCGTIVVVSFQIFRQTPNGRGTQVSVQCSLAEIAINAFSFQFIPFSLSTLMLEYFWFKGECGFNKSVIVIFHLRFVSINLKLNLSNCFCSSSCKGQTGYPETLNNSNGNFWQLIYIP